MNREIKFRVWDRKDNRFLLTLSSGASFSYPDRKSIGLNEILLANNNKGVKGYEFYWFLGFPRFTLQQFTGLKDKNGRELYEGDIISGQFDMGPGGFINHTAQVHFHLEDGYQWNYWDLKTVEVVGNAFDTPEMTSGV